MTHRAEGRGARRDSRPRVHRRARARRCRCAALAPRGLLLARTRVVLIALVLLAGPLAAEAPDPGEAYTLRADNQEWVEETLWRGDGHVEIHYQEITIRCDKVELDLETDELEASGEVVLEQGPRRFTADELHYNLRSKTGRFVNATGDLPPTYHFVGAEVEKLDESRYRLRDATFTTCDLDGRPPWEFHVRSATLREGGYGYFHGTALKVRGVPLVYFPYMVWPIKRERAPGLLAPSFGYSDRRGAYIGNSLYLPLGRSVDTTVLLDYYSNGYYGLGSEWRWAPAPNATGKLTAYTIRDRVGGAWEWKLDGLYRDDDLHGFRLLAEAHDLSDIGFFQEFERDFYSNTLRSLYSYLYLTRSWGPFALNLRADRRKTFLSTTELVLNQLPEVELRVRSTRVGHTPLYWSMISSVNLFDVDRGGELTTTYARADLYPQLSYTIPGPPWLTVTPRVGARGTLYSARLSEDRQAYEKEWVERTYLSGGLEVVGPSFSKIFRSGATSGLRLKHLIEPRFAYSYVSDVGDTSRIPRFDEVDSTLVTNRVRVTLANRLFARSTKSPSARELGSFEVYQEYSFSEPLNLGDGVHTSRRGPLVAALRLTPVNGVTVDARSSYDTLFHNLQSTSLSASAYRGPVSANLTWYEGFLARSGERTSSQIRTYLAFRKQGFPFRLELHLAYDAEQRELQQQRALLYWQGSCWGASVEYRDLRFGPYPSRDYRLVIDFKGIGKMLEVRGGLDSIER